MIIPNANEIIEKIDQIKIQNSEAVKKEIINGIKTMTQMEDKVKIYKGRFDTFLLDKEAFIKELNEAGYTLRVEYEEWEYGSAEYIVISITQNDKDKTVEIVKKNNQTLLTVAIIFGLILLGVYFKIINFS